MSFKDLSSKTGTPMKPLPPKSAKQGADDNAPPSDAQTSEAPEKD